MSEFEFEPQDNLCEYCFHKKECKFATECDGTQECDDHKNLW